MNLLHFPESRDIDLVCLGRLAVDLYAQQWGSPLEDARSMAMYLGGSSANLAFGVGRLGLNSAMISRVGDEQMGRFLLKTLRDNGCDTSQVQVDPARPTGMVLLGLKDQDTFPLLFVRENCADMAIDATQIDPAFIARCRALAITGTHLSTPVTRAAALTALAHAKAHGVVRVLDIDYRPVLWGLTGRGAGEVRFVDNAQVTRSLQEVLPQFDLLVGTEEEFLIAGGVANDLLASLRAVRSLSDARLVVKRGPLGCSVIEGEIPASLDDAPTYRGEQVEVLNVLGAGDAFLAGLMTGLLRGQGWEHAARMANACGAIVVSRHACSAAMPSQDELDHWFSGKRLAQLDRDPQLQHLHRVSVARPHWPEVCVLAFDHREQFVELARQAGAAPERIAQLKSVLVDAAEHIERSCQLQGRFGVLIDGGSMGAQALARATGRQWWVGRPVELPGSRPLRFDGTRSIGSALTQWPTEQVVKCLVHYHPDDAVALRLEQEEKVLEVWEACRASGHEFLLEIICPGSSDDSAVLRAVTRFYNLGVKPHWWKLAPMQADGWDALARLVQTRDSYCRGAVILGLNQPLEQLAHSFAQARNPIVKGFMVGRSIWAQPSAQWLQGTLSDDRFIQDITHNFSKLLTAWQQRHQSH